MPDMPGDTFVSKGTRYVLHYGPKGNLRPYTVGSVAGEVARRTGSWLPKLGWAGLAVGAVILAGVGIWYACRDD